MKKKTTKYSPFTSPYQYPSLSKSLPARNQPRKTAQTLSPGFPIPTSTRSSRDESPFACPFQFSPCATAARSNRRLLNNSPSRFPSCPGRTGHGKLGRSVCRLPGNYGRSAFSPSACRLGQFVWGRSKRRGDRDEDNDPCPPESATVRRIGETASLT